MESCHGGLQHVRTDGDGRYGRLQHQRAPSERQAKYRASIQGCCTRYTIVEPALPEAPQMAVIPEFPGRLPPRGPRPSPPTRVKWSRLRKVRSCSSNLRQPSLTPLPLWTTHVLMWPSPILPGRPIGYRYGSRRQQARAEPADSLTPPLAPPPAFRARPRSCRWVHARCTHGLRLGETVGATAGSWVRAVAKIRLGLCPQSLTVPPAWLARSAGR